MKNATWRGHTLALALSASGIAAAQGNVTLGGQLDLSVGETKPPGGVATKGVDPGRMQTSYITLRGTEDLGGGLSAVFAIESFLRADTGEIGRFGGDTFWSRTSWVGLQSTNFGRVLIGRITTPLFVSTLLFNPFVDSFGYSPSIRHYFASGTVTGDTSWNDSVMLTSPVFGGVTVNLIGSAPEGSNGRNLGGSVVWFGGPAGATLAFQDVKKDAAAPVADTRTWQLGGSYDWKVAKAFAQVGNVENKTSGAEFDLVSLSALVPIGAGQFIGSWGRLKPEVGNKRNTVSLGYQYFLSKNSEIYGAAMRDKVDTLSTGRGYSLGIRQRF